MQQQKLYEAVKWSSRFHWSNKRIIGKVYIFIINTDEPFGSSVLLETQDFWSSSGKEVVDFAFRNEKHY